MGAATILLVNGRARSVSADPETMLLDALHGELGLPAARFGCGEGLCGSCRVLVDGQPVASCTTPLWSLEGRAIVTPEGLGTESDPHPIQPGLIAEQAMQCGYCISGVMIGAAALLARESAPDDAAICAALDPHLCRCGAHNRIIRAVRRAAAEMRGRAA